MASYSVLEPLDFRLAHMDLPGEKDPIRFQTAKEVLEPHQSLPLLLLLEAVI